LRLGAIICALVWIPQCEITSCKEEDGEGDLSRIA
jgi:hypothetical protein